MSSGTDDSARGTAFTESSSWATLRTACEIAGLDDKNARLMRLGENALFHLPEDKIVVRIARSMDYWADAAKEADVAHWLADHSFPAAQLHDTRQPVTADGHPVTFWRFIGGRNGARQDITVLGKILRQLHATPPPTRFALPPDDILGRVRPRISSSAVPTADKDFLLRRLTELQSELPQLQYPLNPTSIHGDPHVQNLMVRDGQPVLIDFERFAWGQPEWDLAVTATEFQTAKWWTDGEYGRFVDAYGYDVTSWVDGFDTLRAVQELKMSTWLMQNVAESAEIADEYQVRMRTLRGEPSPGWRPF